VESPLSVICQSHAGSTKRQTFLLSFNAQNPTTPTPVNYLPGACRLMCLLVTPKSPISPKNNQRPGYAAVRGATLNVHSMRDGFKLADLAISCRKFEQDFLLVQETWRNGSEDLKIQHKTLKNWRFIQGVFF